MIRAVGVVIPAADEEAAIGHCLDSVAEAVHRLREVRPDVQVRTVVVLDGCTDRTREIVAGYEDVGAVVCSARRAGAARRLGVEAALAHQPASLDEMWLANTDADSTVPPDWLVEQLSEAAGGAQVVLGTVLPQPGLMARVEQAWFDGHLLRAGHPHVHGANLGIRADVYADLGGWPNLATGEDVLLARRAAARHIRIARTARIPVLTSVRTTARAPHGFASFLGGLAARVELTAAQEGAQ
ncbi:MAG: glycosyltransferase [Actinomycetota bacterium]|nr:glycosyltransferase [Actinomycetota bacterium]